MTDIKLNGPGGVPRREAVARPPSTAQPPYNKPFFQPSLSVYYSKVPRGIPGGAEWLDQLQTPQLHILNLGCRVRPGWGSRGQVPRGFRSPASKAALRPQSHKGLTLKSEGSLVLPSHPSQPHDSQQHLYLCLSSPACIAPWIWIQLGKVYSEDHLCWL